jgi:Cytosol aminopeptidase family, N-terminal domain
VDVRFASPDLVSLGELKTEALCLPFASDERPLRGPQGLVDWRLSGRVSQLLVRGSLTGALGEMVLMPARPRMFAERLLWMGMGPQASFDEAAFRGVVCATLLRIRGLRVRTAALVFPGRVQERVGAADAMAWFFDLVSEFERDIDEVTVIEKREGQRAMEPVVERVRRRAMLET